MKIANSHLTKTGKYQPHIDFWSTFTQGNTDYDFKQKHTAGAKTETQVYNGGVDGTMSAHITKMVNGSDLGVYVTLLSVVGVLLSKYSRQANVIIHSPLYQKSGEGRVDKHVPIPLIIEQGRTWKEHLLSVQSIVRGCYKFQDVPFEVFENDNHGKALFSSNILLRHTAIHTSVIEDAYDLLVTFSKKRR